MRACPFGFAQGRLCGSTEGTYFARYPALSASSREGRVTERHALGYLIPHRWRWSVVLSADLITLSELYCGQIISPAERRWRVV